MFEAIQDSFTPFLAAGIVLSAATLWAAVMAFSAAEQAPDRQPGTHKRD